MRLAVLQLVLVATALAACGKPQVTAVQCADSVGACERTGQTVFVLDRGKAVHVNGCNVFTHYARNDADIQRATMRYVCGASPDTINDQKWWGDKPEPLMFTVDVGDCMLMAESYYCLEDVVHAESATFRVAYKKPSHPLGNLERVR
jgi:hypothetical protein